MATEATFPTEIDGFGVDDYRRQVETAFYELEDAAEGVRRYQSSLHYDAERLAAVGERLELLRALQRKYGGSVAAVLDYAKRAHAELAALERSREAGAAVVALPCIGHLPPSFIDFLVTRGRVDGVLLTGCRAGDCHYRQGIDWMDQRIGGRRDPYLRARVPRERVAWTWPGADGAARLRFQTAAGKQLRQLAPRGLVDHPRRARSSSRSRRRPS